MDKSTKIIATIIGGLLVLVVAVTWGWLSVKSGELLPIPDQLITIGNNIFYMLFGGVAGGVVGAKMKKTS